MVYESTGETEEGCGSILECGSGLTCNSDFFAGYYDGAIIAAAHKQFFESGPDAIRSYCKPVHLVFDLKYIFPRDPAITRL